MVGEDDELEEYHLHGPSGAETRKISAVLVSPVDYYYCNYKPRKTRVFSRPKFRCYVDHLAIGGCIAWYSKYFGKPP
jgi:hypothetical protein